MPATIDEILEAARDLETLSLSPLQQWRRANGQAFRRLVDAFAMAERQGVRRQFFFKAAVDLLEIGIDPVVVERELVGIVKAQREATRTGGAQTVLFPPDGIEPRTR